MEPTFEAVWDAMEFGSVPLPIAMAKELAAYFWRARQGRIDRLEAVVEAARKAPYWGPLSDALEDLDDALDKAG